VRLGITAALTDTSMDPAALAREVEDRGFDSLFLPEHTHLPLTEAEPPQLVGGVDLDGYRRILDPFVGLASAASVTERIKLGTGVCLVAQHDPIVLAKVIATLDHLSGGRVVLGVGFGWNAHEAEAHGVPFSQRRAVAEDKMRCMEALWTQDEAAYEGRFVSLQPSYSWPKPRQQPRPRTLIGGGAGPKLLRAVASWADGWMPIGGAGVAAALPKLRQEMEAVGRDAGELSVVPFGTIPDEGKLEHFRSLGIDEVVLRLPSGDAASMRRSLDDLTPYLGFAAQL
jgi:probable F420-dependent oxidoreductase